MSKIVRVQCPICGFLGNQNRLNEEHEFKVVIQHITSRGRGRITHRYYQPEHEEGIFILKAGLAKKMEAVARQLRREVQSEKGDLFREKVRDGKSTEYWDWVDTSNVTRRAVVDTVDGVSAVVMVKPEEPQTVQSVSEPSPIIERVSPSLWRSIRIQKPSLVSSEADRYEEAGDDIAESELALRTRLVQPVSFRTGGAVESQEGDETFESEGILEEEGGEGDGIVQSDNEVL
jgi:hypothetical protein